MMRKDIHAYYQALGLNEGAGPAEIRRAYRQLVQTWHPDLFKPGSPMQMTAEDITKEINEAYEQLYRKKLYRKFSPKAEPPKNGAEGPGGEAGNPQAADAGDGDVSAAQDAEGRRPGSDNGPGGGIRARWRASARAWGRALRPRRIPWRRAAFAAGVALAAVAAGEGLREVLKEAPGDGAPPVQTAFPADTIAAPAPVSAAGRAPEPARPADSLRQAARRSGVALREDYLRARPDIPEIRGLTAKDTTMGFGGSEASHATRDLGRVFEKASTLLDVFDVGDPKSKVIAIQGAPDDAGETVFRYGSSLVYFENGRVTGWSDRLPWLHVRSWSIYSLASLDAFSLGSTRSDVIRAQGEPTGFTPRGYFYGTSYVRFENDVVAGWSAGDVDLRTFNIPRLPFAGPGRLALW